MKYQLKLIINLLTGCMLVAGCSDFLNQNPKDQLERLEALENQQNYYDALNGVYVLLGGNELFGHHLTYGIIEQMARNHAIDPASEIFFWQYGGAEVKGTVTTIWDKMYAMVANVNSVLDEIDNHRSIFDEGVYELLKGELLTIRAFAHYTLVKLYAPDYNAQPSARGIPYRTVFKNPKITPFSSVEKVYSFILKDLEEAEKLLFGYDPAVNGFGDYATGYPEIEGRTDIFRNRRLRFNYWCNIAIQARVYQSMNNYPKALEHAKKIIGSIGILDWITEERASSNSFRDVIYWPEMISGLHVPKLQDYYKTYFAGEIYSTTKNPKESYFENQIFDANASGAFDYRLLYLFKKSSELNNTTQTSLKYHQLNVSDIPVYDEKTVVPIAKLGEMYLIAAEALCMLNTDGDLSEPIRLLKTLRIKRGVISGLEDNITKEELHDFILCEYRRECYLEGQLFYQYKRRNLSSMPDLTELGYMPVNENTYLLPVPEVELEENDESYEK